MKLQKGDTVLVRTGKDKGKSGSIIKVLPDLNKVVVDGINVSKRATKPSTKNPRGGIVSEPQPIWVSNVGIVHPASSKRTSRIGYKLDAKGKKARVYRQADNKEVK